MVYVDDVGLNSCILVLSSTVDLYNSQVFKYRLLRTVSADI